MTLVKICGLKTTTHVQDAVEAGAHFIGFVFAPSKREVTIEEATELVKKIPKYVKKVGVFVNCERQKIEKIWHEVGLDYIQYHGDESPQLIKEIGLPSIRAFSVRTTEDVIKAATYDVDYYLFDAPGIQYRGGEGHVFDWSLLQNCPISNEKIILAGGLTSENVASAIQSIHPFAVDVSSGVETNNIKDSSKIKAFIEQAKGAI